jgi:hypothetical protein
MVARQSVTTLTSRNTSMRSVAPIMNQVAKCSTGCRARSGTATEDSSHPTNVASKTNANSVMATFPTGRRPARRRRPIGPGVDGAGAAGPASPL